MSRISIVARRYIVTLTSLNIVCVRDPTLSHNQLSQFTTKPVYDFCESSLKVSLDTSHKMVIFVVGKCPLGNYMLCILQYNFDERP